MKSCLVSPPPDLLLDNQRHDGGDRTIRESIGAGESCAYLRERLIEVVEGLRRVGSVTQEHLIAGLHESQVAVVGWVPSACLTLAETVACSLTYSPHL